MPLRIVDCHTHTLARNPEYLERLRKRYGMEKYNVLGVPCMGDALNNLYCLRLKAKARDHVYAFGGVTYFAGGGHEGFDLEARLWREAGGDGIKLLETKPDYMRRIGLPMDGPAYAPLFEYCQQTGFPILWHVGDPAAFWSAETAPAFAVENGWCYEDPSYCSLSELYRQTEAVLDRYPNLQVCLAHFYFTGDDLNHARRMMEKYPLLRFDITPGTEMYGHFLHNMDQWQEFFFMYQDRILYGTDLTDEEENEASGLNKILVGLCRKMLQGEKNFTVWDMKGSGFQLSEMVRQKIYADNFEQMAGARPAALSRPGLKSLQKWYEEQLAEAGMQKELPRCGELFRDIFSAL